MGDTDNKYFVKYLDQKFEGIHTKMDDFICSMDEKHDLVKKEIEELKKNDKWQDQKIWMAMGGIAVIGVTGAILASFFKTLNRHQVEDAVSQALENKQFEVNE